MPSSVVKDEFITLFYLSFLVVTRILQIFYNIFDILHLFSMNSYNNDHVMELMMNTTSMTYLSRIFWVCVYSYIPTVSQLSPEWHTNVLTAHAPLPLLIMTHSPILYTNPETQYMNLSLGTVRVKHINNTRTTIVCENKRTKDKQALSYRDQTVILKQYLSVKNCNINWWSSDKVSELFLFGFWRLISRRT